MKIPPRIVPGLLLVFAGLVGLSSCATDGYVEAGTGVYYGGPYYADPWFHEGPWVYGRPWHGAPADVHAGAYIHPPRVGHSHPGGNHPVPPR
jgi:hypothetical protein